MESQALVNGGSMGTVITRMAMLRAQAWFGVIMFNGSLERLAITLGHIEFG